MRVWSLGGGVLFLFFLNQKSGPYASYWNPFLFKNLVFSSHFADSKFKVRPGEAAYPEYTLPPLGAPFRVQGICLNNSSWSLRAKFGETILIENGVVPTVYGFFYVTIIHNSMHILFMCILN